MKTRIQYLAIGSTIIILVVALTGVAIYSYSGPQAKIVFVEHSPLNPTSTNPIMINVSTTGGAQLLESITLDIEYATHHNGTAEANGGATMLYNENNKYNIEIGPFANGTILWYVIRILDRGVSIYSESYEIEIGTIGSTISRISMPNTTPLWSYNDSEDTVTALFITNVNSTLPIKEGGFALIGFLADGGSFGYSGEVTHLENNTYVATFYPEKQLWHAGTNIFYRFSFKDSGGTIILSNVEGTIIG